MGLGLIPKGSFHQGLIEFLHSGDRPFTITAQHNAIGIKGVIDGGTFPQKFRVAHHIKGHGLSRPHLFPAIDPIESYSKYLEYPELQRVLNEQIEEGWTEKVNELKNILLRGKEAAEQINILGDDGVSIDTGDALRVVRLPDGYYVAGRGLLIPVDSREEGEEVIRDMTAKENHDQQ